GVGGGRGEGREGTPGGPRPGGTGQRRRHRLGGRRGAVLGGRVRGGAPRHRGRVFAGRHRVSPLRLGGACLPAVGRPCGLARSRRGGLGQGGGADARRRAAARV